MAIILANSLLGVFPLGLFSSLSQTTRSTALYLLIISSLLLVPNGIPHSDIPSKSHLNNPLAADSTRPVKVPTCTLKNGLSHVTMHGTGCPGVHKFYEDNVDTLSSMFTDNLVEFVPPILHFDNHPVGQHTDKPIQIINHSQTRTLHLTSVSGTSSDFHPSFFQSEFVPPGEHTYFDVYFLPREVGPIESTLNIHSEDGFTFPLPVSGVGITNPYHLRSLSARIPLNYSYSPTVSVYNPHGHALQITEMYSTALDLHLELLSSTAATSWEVPPYQSKEVMRVNFFADRLDHYTAFIRIKTNFDNETGAQLIIPLEVEVVSRENIISAAQELDFGLIRSSDELKAINITLYNPSQVTYKVTSLSASRTGRYVTTQLFQPALVDPGVVLSVGALKLNPRDLPLNLSLITGSVLVNVSSGEGSNKRLESVRIPYRARIEYGHLNVPNLNLHSSVLPSRPQTVSVWLSHTFKHSLAVFEAKISYTESEEDTGYLSLHEFHWPLLILPHDRAIILSLRFMPTRALIFSQSYLHLHTNTSRFRIPIHIYNQQLELTDGAGELEFGVIHPNITKNHFFKVRNLNADVITVREMIISNPHLTFEKMVMLPLQEGQLISVAGTEVPFVIQAKHEATLHYKLIRPTSGDIHTEVILVTDHQRLYVRVHYRSISGTLEAQRITFQPSFPGHVEKRDIIVRNTFTQTVRLNDLRRIDPTDPRIYLEDPSIGRIELSAFSSTHIAKLAFDPIRGFPGKVFTGGFSETQSTDWLNSLDLRGSAAEVDTRLYERTQAIWKECQNEELTRAAAIFELDTDLVSGIRVEVEASLQWPSITPDAPIHFPLTLIGNYSTRSVPVFNPGDLPLVVQALLLHLYPDEQAALDIVDDWLDIPSSPSRRVSPFSLRETYSGMYHRPDTTHPTSYHETLGKSVSDLAWTHILPPKSTINITVVFEPQDEDPVFSVVLFRNNLTIMDAVVIQGSGAEGKFSLDGKTPDSDETLFFNMTQDKLVECSRHDQISPSALSLTHTYIARNQGQLSIHIESLSINGYPCQGFGFSIRQCKPFTLKPNSSTEIDITFTPDFTLYYIHRELILMTRHGQSLTFKLHAVIPSEYLPVCSRVTMRATWEPYLPYITLPVLLAALVLAIYLSFQPEEGDILSMSIPGMRNSYNAEGMDKVIRLASMFSFSGGIDENPEELKRRLDKSSSLVESIVTMHRQASGEQDGERTPRVGAMLSSIQSPIHQDLMDVMKSSYKPELTFRVSNGSSGGHRPEPSNHNGSITGIVSPQKTSVVKPIQILERQSQLSQQLSGEVKRNTSPVLKPTSKPKPEQPIEVTPKNRNEEKKERVTKPDLKVVIPSNDVSCESESKRDSPTSLPAVQPIRPGKCKKSKSRKQKEKEKSKPSKPNSPSPDILQSQDIQETPHNEINEEQLPDKPIRKSIVNPNRLSIYNSDVSKTNQPPSTLVSTPPKGPLPLHRSISNETPICTQKSSPQRKPNTTLSDEKVQEQSRVQIPVTSSPLKSTVQEVKPFKREQVKNNLTESTKSKSEEDKAQLLPPDSNKGMRIITPNIQNYTPISNHRSTLPKSTPYIKDRPTLASNSQSAAKELSCNLEQKNKKLTVLTREEDEVTQPSSPVRAKVKKEIVKEESKETASKPLFSDMSEELRQRIEEVCGPLALDTPFLTGEPHEQLSSILSTDAEPFIPDANVVRQLLENNHVPQSIKKSPRKFPQQQPQQQQLQQPQQQLQPQQSQQQQLPQLQQPQPQQLQQTPIQLDPHTLSQLSILLQDPSQTCLPQSDYINLLANSLGIQPRILSLHLQYCWLSYYCNLMNMTATTRPKPHAPPLDTPIYKPIQEGLVGKQQSMTDKPGSTAVLEEVPSDIPLSSGYTVNTNINTPASNAGKWPLDGNNLNAKKPANFAKSNSGGSRGNSSLFGTFSHWSDSPKGKGNNWKVSPNKDSVLRAHDDSSYFESNMEYDDVKEDSLSRSDPWRREKRQKTWSTPSKQEPPPLSATELLPTELMTSRPPSPVSDQVPLPAGAPRSQAPIGQQPSIFLGNTIWSDRESITEEDRLNSWSNLTGKFAQKGNHQTRERMYNPFGEGSWGPLEDIGRRKKGGRPE